MSLMLMPTSSTPCGVNISMLGKEDSSTSISTCRWSSEPARSFSRNFSRVACELVLVLLRVVAQVARDRPRRHQELQQAVLGAHLRGLAHRVALLLLDHADGDLDQVAHHRLDVAPDVAHLGELARLDLQERRLGEPRQAARDLGLADAGRADHQDVLGRDLVGDLGRELLAPPAVAQGDGDRALGLLLADDVLVELDHDLARRHVLERLDGGLDLSGELSRHLPLSKAPRSSADRW